MANRQLTKVFSKFWVGSPRFSLSLSLSLFVSLIDLSQLSLRHFEPLENGRAFGSLDITEGNDAFLSGLSHRRWVREPRNRRVCALHLSTPLGSRSIATRSPFTQLPFISLRTLLPHKIKSREYTWSTVTALYRSREWKVSNNNKKKKKQLERTGEKKLF